MPWEERSKMSLRAEFVMLAAREGANRRALCRRFAVSPTTGYTWLGRAAGGERDFADRSRRPRTSPRRVAPEMEATIVALRDEHPAWGGRKLARRLRDLGHAGVPSASTITQVLRRHERLEAPSPRALQRFARETPNALWQMDFKSELALADASSCHPLTVIDDCARYALGLEACADQRGESVRTRLLAIFGRYGLPAEILSDNGPPWGSLHDGTGRAFTALGVWLIELGITIRHGRPYHPQTQGKDERFHRTLQAEVIGRRQFRDLAHVQRAFDAWRHVYNCERPHQALDLEVPIRRYSPRPRSLPERIEPYPYAAGCVMRRVAQTGTIGFAGYLWRVGKAFAGRDVALRPTDTDGLHDVFFCHQRVTTIDLTDPP